MREQDKRRFLVRKKGPRGEEINFFQILFLFAYLNVETIFRLFFPKFHIFIGSEKSWELITKKNHHPPTQYSLQTLQK